MKREFVKQALKVQYSKLSIKELEKVVGIELQGRENHVIGMMIHFAAEDESEHMSEEEINEFLIKLEW